MGLSQAKYRENSRNKISQSRYKQSNYRTNQDSQIEKLDQSKVLSNKTANSGKQEIAQVSVGQLGIDMFSNQLEESRISRQKTKTIENKESKYINQKKKERSLPHKSNPRKAIKEVLARKTSVSKTILKIDEF